MIWIGRFLRRIHITKWLVSSLAVLRKGAVERSLRILMGNVSCGKIFFLMILILIGVRCNFPQTPFKCYHVHIGDEVWVDRYC